MIMPHSSNGSHRRIAIKEPQAASEHAESTTERVEAVLSEMQEVVTTKSTEFIRQHPGASLLLAAAIGGVIGWFIKRRG
jgi:ElaB/YqjD/DUF883 family membrane-anchored ribosome-binding protein